MNDRGGQGNASVGAVAQVDDLEAVESQGRQYRLRVEHVEAVSEVAVDAGVKEVESSVADHP